MCCDSEFRIFNLTSGKRMQPGGQGFADMFT